MRPCNMTRPCKSKSDGSSRLLACTGVIAALAITFAKDAVGIPADVRDCATMVAAFEALAALSATLNLDAHRCVSFVHAVLVSGFSLVYLGEALRSENPFHGPS